MKTALRSFASLLILSILISIFPIYAADSDMVRIGLYYGTDTLKSANLENSSGYGAGYRFGYFDDALQFIPLAETGDDITQLTVLRASTFYRSGSNYSMTDNGGDVIGCYHIALATGLNSFDEAVALASDYDGAFVAWIQGDYQLRLGAYLTKDEALSAQTQLGLDGDIVGTSAYAMNTVETGSSEILFQYDGGAKSALGIYPDVTGAEEIRTWFKGYRYNGAFRYERIDGGSLSVTNVLDLETYVKGVVPYEMTNTWPLEALKAQAICARTYAQSHIEKSNHTTFDLCNSDCCQVYRGVGANSSSYQASALTNQAVEETAGEFLWYDDQLAVTYYSSSHGGGSESIANIWSGGDLSETPYLCGVVDPYEELIASKNSYSSWTRTFTKSQLTTLLQNRGYGIGTEVKGLETIYSPTGNVVELIVYFANGKTVTYGPSFLTYSNYLGKPSLGLPSIRFNLNGNVVEGKQSKTAVTNTSGLLAVNGGQSLADRDELYTIDGDGNKKALNTNNDIYVLTGSGDMEKLDFSTSGDNLNPSVDPSTDLSGRVYTEASTYTFNGAGWGHSVGLSQWGAYAMADVLDMSYEEIVTFYFPGTYISN